MSVKNSILFFLTGLLLLAGTVCFGQDLEASDLQGSPTNLVQWKDGRRNATYTTQRGSQNELEINQFNSSSSNTNLARVYQEGTSNSVQIQQIGQNIHSDILQTGNNNFVKADVINSSNVASRLQQTGNENTLEQNIHNSNQVEVLLIQNGNNNYLQHTVVGQSNMQFQFTQNGNNMRASINQSE